MSAEDSTLGKIYCLQGMDVPADIASIRADMTHPGHQDPHFEKGYGLYTEEIHPDVLRKILFSKETRKIRETIIERVGLWRIRYPELFDYEEYPRWEKHSPTRSSWHPLDESGSVLFASTGKDSAGTMHFAPQHALLQNASARDIFPKAIQPEIQTIVESGDSYGKVATEHVHTHCSAISTENVVPEIGEQFTINFSDPTIVILNCSTIVARTSHELRNVYRRKIRSHSSES